MKRDDEFNVIKVTNEKGTNSFEFGKTQNNEFSFYKENKSNENRDELNPSTNKNNENVKLGKNQTNNNDLIEKLIDSSSQVSASTTSSASSSAATASTAATTASTGATVTSVVASSVVAVATVAGTVGITVVSSNNAQCKFDEFYVGESYVSYALQLTETEGVPFRLWIENINFLAYNELHEGGNEGFFENLETNQTYRIYVKEESDSGKIIYDSSFTTIKEARPEPQFNSVTFSSEANYLDYTFDVSLDYLDEYDELSNFVLSVWDSQDENLKKTFELNKTIEKQTLSGLDATSNVVLDVRNSTFAYSLSYKNKGNDVLVNGDKTISFTDSTNSKSEFSGISISSSASYLNSTFEVTLDFVDDFEIYSDFELELFDNSNSSVRVPLLKQATTQTVDLSNLDFDIKNKEISFKLFYIENGIEKTFEDIAPQTFIDSDGVVASIDEVVISDTANYRNYTFTIELNYYDPLDYLSELKLEVFEVGSTNKEVVELIKQTGEQTVDLTKGGTATPIDIRNKEVSFKLTYVNKGEEEELSLGNKTFVDDSGVVIEMKTPSISEYANYFDYTFELTLNYEDEFDYIDDITLTLIEVDSTAVGNSQTVSLIKQKESQTVNLLTEQDKPPVDIRNKSIRFVLSWVNLNEEESMDIDAIRFIDNSGKTSEVNGLTISDAADYLNYTFSVTLDYIDEFDILDNYKLSMSSTSVGGEERTDIVSLTETTDSQEIDLVSINEDPLNLRDYEISFSLTYDKNGVTQAPIDLGNKRFTDSTDSKSEVTGATISDDANFLTSVFSITLDYQDDFNYLSDFSLEVAQVDEIADVVPSYEINLEKTTETQPVDISEADINIAKKAVSCVLHYSYRGQRQSLELGNKTFTDNSGTVTSFNSITISDSADYLNYTFDVQLDFDDTFDYYYDFELTLTSTDDSSSQTVPLTKSLETQQVDLTQGGTVTPIDIRKKTFNVSVSYKDERLEETQQYNYPDTVRFTNNNPIDPVINGVSISDTADYVNYTFTVTLDYEDVLDVIDSFTLLMVTRQVDSGEEVATEIPLEKTLEAQTINFATYQETYKNLLRKNEFSFVLNYEVEGETQTFEDIAPVTFTDSSGKESVFTGVSINPNASFANNTFELTLDYDDPLNIFVSASLTLYNANKNADFELELTTSAQTVNCTVDGEVLIPLWDGEYSYTVVLLDYDGNMHQVSGEASVQFVDEDYERSFTGVTFDEFADFVDGEFYVTLDFVDVYEDYQNIQLMMTYGETENYNFALNHTTNKQAVVYKGTGNYNFNPGKGPWTYEIWIDFDADRQLMASGEVSFQNSRQSVFSTLNSDFEAYQIDSQIYLPIQLDFDDDDDEFREFNLYIGGTQYSLENTNGWQNVIIDNSLIGETTSFDVRCAIFDYETQTVKEEESVYSITQTISLSTTPKVYGANCLTEETSGQIEFQLLVTDFDKKYFDTYKIIFVVNENRYQFDIDISDIEFTEGNVVIDIQSNSELMELLETNSVDFYLSYRTISTGSVSEICFQKGYSLFISH